MSNRWISENTCINIQLEGNHYVLLPSTKDNYFTPQHQFLTEVVKVLEEESAPGHELPHFKLYDIGSESKTSVWKNNKKTFITIPRKAPALQRDVNVMTFGSIFSDSSFKSKMSAYPSFYLSTALSASLHPSPGACLSELLSGHLLFYQKEGLSFLGPTENLWSSQCASDLSMEIVDGIREAAGR